MTAKQKRHSMAEALKERDDIRSFLEAGESRSGNVDEPNSRPKAEPGEKRIAVTLWLPERIAHALIDESATRRKKREKAWSQQDIVVEAIEKYLCNT